MSAPRRRALVSCPPGAYTKRQPRTELRRCRGSDKQHRRGMSSDRNSGRPAQLLLKVSSTQPPVTESPRPTADDVEISPLADRIITGIVTAVPFLALALVAWQVWD